MADFVLVHSARCWKRILPGLWQAGRRAFAVTLTGTGERAHQLSPGVTLRTHVSGVAAVIDAEALQHAIVVMRDRVRRQPASEHWRCRRPVPSWSACHLPGCAISSIRVVTNGGHHDPVIRHPSWTEFLTERDPPVLRLTGHAIAAAGERVDRINVREIANIVLHDPMMTARVLRFSAAHRGRRQLQDLSTVEHAVMMLGVEPFFHHFAQFDVIEDHLKPQTLLGLLQVVRRAQRASRFALDWATWRCDLSSEEVAIAALLHDLAEMLVWCYAPDQAVQVQALQKVNPSMRSADAQAAVLGFPLHELQVLVCRTWELPELLLMLMDDASLEKTRVKNVKLAVDLARHTAHGWNDPALPDDFRAIAALMNIDENTLRVRLGVKMPGEEDAQDA